MDKVIKNYKEPLLKPMTTKAFISEIFNKRRIKKHNKKYHNHQNQIEPHVHDESCGPQYANPVPKNIETVSFAILIDDVVVDVMTVQDSFGEILSKNPKFVKLDPKKDRPMAGFIYVDDKFIPFEEHIKKIRITSRGSSV